MLDCGIAFSAPPRVAMLCAIWAELNNLKADLLNIDAEPLNMGECDTHEPVQPPSQPEPEPEEESGDESGWEEEEEASEIPETGPEHHSPKPVIDKSADPAVCAPPPAAAERLYDSSMTQKQDPTQNPLGL